jgi:uncharacterized protein YecT (DUF1311 family)
MRTIVLAAAGFLAFAPSAGAQSFDCLDRLSEDERVICNSPSLSRLDEQLAEVYEDALAGRSTSQRDRLRTEQRDWVELRRNCRRRRSCIKRLYQDRLAELREEGRRRPVTRGDEASDGRDRWAALGSVEVDDDFDRLTIPVGFSRGQFDAVQVRVRGAGARVRYVIVIYGNGERHRMRIRRTFRAGELSDLLELRHGGMGRVIERIIVRARTRRLDDREGRIEVIGRRAYQEPGRRGIARDRDERPDRRADIDEDRFEDERRDDVYDDAPDRDARGYADDRYDRGERNERGPVRDDDGRDVKPIQDRLLGFVKNEFHRTAEMSADELRRTYASRVNYYGDRRKSVSAIIRDKHKYAERWPDRAFRIHDDTFKVTEMEAPGVFEVTYNYDFHVRGGDRQSKGYGVSTLLIDTSGESFVILGENGKVLKRD